MTNPITPPPKLIEEWWGDRPSGTSIARLATQAAQWGADQEMEACVAWLDGYEREGWAAQQLRAARRPKPPSLKKQAIAALSEISIEPCLINDVDVNAAVCAKYNTIRRALEALND